MNEPTIFIIDDDLEICAALSCLFKSIHLKVEYYHSANLFLENYNSSLQGCLIIDVRMPEMSGLQLLETLHAKKNTLPIIIITGYGDIQMAVRAMKAGAVDFILKPINGQYLLETAQHYLKPAVNKRPPPSNKKNILTQREQEVMNMIIDGKLNKQIASELNISISTVEAHRARIMHKFNAKNVAKLIQAYFQITN
jgi:two-component system, LuxR family, response regulator FixJ